MRAQLQWIGVAAWSVCSFATGVAKETQSIEEFNDVDDVSSWQIVNDGVMGGRSTSQKASAEIDSGNRGLEFTGKLSLENNGGFASVRSRSRGRVGLQTGDAVVLRVKGDGRRYTLNLYTGDRRTAFSYQADFETRNGQWVEVVLPVNRFVAHSFGRPLPNIALNPRDVREVGILLGDKRPGEFGLLIDWIRIRSP